MDFSKEKAIFLQIADDILDSILSLKWQQGSRIPSVRDMAVTMEVNPNTVIRTYAYLQGKKILFNKRGIGYFVADDAIANTKEIKKQEFLKKELPRIINAMKLLDLTFDDIKDLIASFPTEK